MKIIDRMKKIKLGNNLALFCSLLGVSLLAAFKTVTGLKYFMDS